MRLKAEKLKRGNPLWYQKGLRVFDPSVSLRWRADHGQKFSYGLVIKKKAGNAVMRQKIKRRLRHALCRVRGSRSGCALLFASNPELASMPFEALSQHLNKLFNQANESSDKKWN